MNYRIYIFILIIISIITISCNDGSKRIEKAVEESINNTILKADIHVYSTKDKLTIRLIQEPNGIIKYPELLRVYFMKIIADLENKKYLKEYDDIFVVTNFENDSVYYSYSKQEVQTSYTAIYNNDKFLKGINHIEKYWPDSIYSVFNEDIVKSIPLLFPNFKCQSAFLDILYQASLEYKNFESYSSSDACSCIWALQIYYGMTQQKEYFFQMKQLLSSMGMEVMNYEKVVKTFGNEISIK